MINKKVLYDILLNIVSISIPVFILQFIVYPISSRFFDADTYGLMLTIYSLWIMISNTFGNVLNNIRLLKNEKYNEKNIQGDFLVIYRKWNGFNAIIICGIIIFYSNEFNLFHIFLGVFVAFLVLTKAYAEVGFRIVINYKLIAINNILQGLGYLIGCFFAIISNIWEFIFLLGYLIPCLFVAKKTNLLKEQHQRTVWFKETKSDCNRLLIATIIYSMINYADKLVLYPLMGGHAVAIYYTATILGKMIGMVTSPISNVLLTYVAKWKTDRNIFGKILLVSVFLVVAGYIITLLLAKPIIGFLYPQWVEDVMIYMPITTANVSLLTLISILSPFVLKFCDMKWQIVINGVGTVVYFISALFLWKLFGLTGFCIGTVIGTAAQLGVMIIVYYKTYSNKLDV